MLFVGTTAIPQMETRSIFSCASVATHQAGGAQTPSSALPAAMQTAGPADLADAEGVQWLATFRIFVSVIEAPRCLSRQFSQARACG